MERTFPVKTFKSFVASGLQCTLIAAIFLAGPGVSGAWGAGWVFFALILIGCGLYLMGRLYGIRVTATGDVVFLRLSGNLSIAAMDIASVQGVRTAQYNGTVEWTMDVRDRTGLRITVGLFGEARASVQAITALNPQIDVTGDWPSAGFPEPGERIHTT
jgi:hypothetical protein